MYILLDVCQKSNVLELISFLLKALRLVCIIVPIMLIVLITIDFIKGIVASQEEIKKIFSTVIKRIIYAALIFFVPLIVNVIVGILGDLGVDYMECIENATDEKIEYYKAQEEANKTGSSTTNGSSTGSAISPTSSSNKKEEEADVEFKITKDKIVIGHYRNTVNKYTIELKSKGKVLNNSKYNFTSKNPAIASVNKKGVVTGNFGGETTITVTSKKNKKNKQKITVLVTHTLYTKVKVTRTVTGVSAKTGENVRVSAGTEGLFNGIGPNTSPNGYLLGDTIKVNGDYVRISYNYVKPVAYYASNIYSEEDVENFVNEFGFDSDTSYLFWTSNGTGMEYMFRGTKGKWKLYKQFYINVGDAAQLFQESNRTGVHFNYYIGETDTRFGYNHPVIWKNSSPTHHTNPWHEGGSTSRLPASHGCTRFLEKDILYLLSIHSKIKGSRIIEF